MFSIVMSHPDFQVACVGDLGAGSCMSATNIVYVAFRQEVLEKELQTGLQKDVLLQVNVNDLSSSLSSLSPSVCQAYRVNDTAASSVPKFIYTQ
jgi:hypothetical protein